MTADLELDRVRGRIDTARLDALLLEAVSCYSPSYAEEPVMEVFAEALLAAGLPFERQPVDDPDGPEGRANLLVRVGPQPPGLLWVGHVDTVAFPDDEPRRPTVADGILHGLGAADMKAGCAAALEALRALAPWRSALRRGLCVALVVGEEEYGDGTRTLVEQVTAPLVMVGEPTELVPCTDHHGYLECTLVCTGHGAHAALPELGESAIHAMLAWMQHLIEHRGELPMADLVAINPREIQGGNGVFAVADRCSALVDVHLPPDLDVSCVRHLLESSRAAAQTDHPGCQLTWEETLWAPGYRTDPRAPELAPVRRAFERLGRPFQPAPFRSHSDAVTLRAAGMTPLVCGPGSLEVAHTSREHVALEEVHQAAHLYAALLVEACG